MLTERVRKPGTAHGINDRETSGWGAAAARLSRRGGVDQVVEVDGAGTLAQSMGAIGFTGEGALIGVLAGEADTTRTRCCSTATSYAASTSAAAAWVIA